MIRLLVADDHPVVRSGIRHLLREATDMRVAAEAATASDVLREVDAREFDAILLDLSFPDGTGYDVLDALRGRKSQVPVIVFTNAIDAATRCVDAGARAFVAKESGIDELRAAISAAVSGKRYVGSRSARYLDDSAPADVDGAAELHQDLSPRERDIMLRLVRGARPKEIARDLDISEKTVATHRARLMKKLRVDDNRQLLLYALKAGLTDWA
ncbi:MAG TPA: response regulator transcription factor [Thermoanaerobaculia bacterium]|nr:response regulator transcription factor [Thermoanaerobaculia bacterium]